MSATGRSPIRCETPSVIGGFDGRPVAAQAAQAAKAREEYASSGDPAAAERAVRLWEAAIAVEPTPHNLGELAGALLDLYQVTGEGRDAHLDVAVAAVERAIRDAGEDGPLAWLGLLASALSLRWRATGDPNDLDEGLRVFELIAPSGDGPAAVAVRPEHRSEHARLLLDRFERDGDTADLDHALALFEQAIQETPQRDPAHAVLLNNRGLCLRERFEHRGRIADLDSATTAFRRAIELAAPGAPGRATYLENLANCLVDWYRVDDDLTRLEQAVVTLTDALGWLPDGSPQRPRVRANLAGALWHRWTENRDDRDLEAVIGILREVVDDVGPASARWLSTLAVALEGRYHDRGEAMDLAEATAMYRRVCESAASNGQAGDARWSLLAARNWGRWAMERASWAEAAQAHAFGRAAARSLVATQNRRWQRDEWLLQASGLAVESAVTSVALGDLGAAVLALEEDRTLVLSEAFTVESVDLAGLAAAGHPGLAARYRAAANRLVALTRYQVRDLVGGE
jgi:tetratricopeptide (TPR) repeat protein